MAKLTEKQKRFVEEYMIDLNATQAAIRAGYSPNTASEQGHQLLNKTSVREGVARAKAERSKRTGINADRVLLEIAKIAFVNAADVIVFNDATVNGGADREDLACIASVRVKEIPTDEGTITEREVRLYDKLKALDMLTKHLGINEGADSADETPHGVVKLPAVDALEPPPVGDGDG